MKISKKSWHYRLNNNIQGYSFVDRIASRRFTTCTYIRTTIRSMFQTLFAVSLMTALAVVAAAMLINAVWIPLAIWLDLPYIHKLIPAAVVFWLIVVAIGAIYLFSTVEKRLKAKLSERHEKKLSLLEQRIKDGKEGICTIVEVA